MPITKDNIHEVVTHHLLDAKQLASISNIRVAAETMLEVIVLNCPLCEDTTAACRKVREAMMTASAAVVLKGLV